MVHITPNQMTDGAPEVAKHFIQTIFRPHGLPSQIVSDRDSRFTGTFWRSLMKSLRIEQGMSMAFHPETDGQSEHAIRNVEQVLQHYVDYCQQNWDELLPLVEFAINNSQSSTTGHSPFFLNTGLHPLLPAFHGQSLDNPASLTTSEAIRDNLALATDLIKKAQDTQQHYANQHRRPFELQPFDQVLLNSEHITTDNQQG